MKSKLLMIPYSMVEISEEYILKEYHIFLSDPITVIPNAMVRYNEYQGV